MLPPGVRVSRKLELEVVSECEPRRSDMGCGCHKGDLNHHTERTAQRLGFNPRGDLRKIFHFILKFDGLGVKDLGVVLMM